MPGRCAAPPAPAIDTIIPFFSKFSAYLNNLSGVLCADIIFTSCCILSSFKIIEALFIQGQSDWLPITIETKLSL